MTAQRLLDKPVRTINDSLRKAQLVGKLAQQARLAQQFCGITDQLRMGRPERSAMSSSECSPSERFSTQSRALIFLPDRLPARGTVEISLPKLWFAVRVLIVASDCSPARPQSPHKHEAIRPTMQAG